MCVRFRQVMIAALAVLTVVALQQIVFNTAIAQDDQARTGQTEMTDCKQIMEHKQQLVSQMKQLNQQMKEQWQQVQQAEGEQKQEHLVRVVGTIVQEHQLRDEMGRIHDAVMSHMILHARDGDANAVIQCPMVQDMKNKSTNPDMQADRRGGERSETESPERESEQEPESREGTRSDQQDRE